VYCSQSGDQQAFLIFEKLLGTTSSLASYVLDFACTQISRALTAWCVNGISERTDRRCSTTVKIFFQAVDLRAKVLKQHCV